MHTARAKYKTYRWTENMLSRGEVVNLRKEPSAWRLNMCGKGYIDLGVGKRA
jgi:hypothetical protein